MLSYNEGPTCSCSPRLMLRFAQILPAPVSLEKRPSSPFRPHAILPRRFRGHFFGLLFLAAVAFFFHYNQPPTPTSTPAAENSDDILALLRGLPKPEGGRKPPRFYEWHDREKLLPQHDVNLPYPQGREGRYIRFTNQVCCTSSCHFFAAAAAQQRY